MTKSLKNILLLFLLVSSVACSKFRKIQKSPDWKVKYEAALKYYEVEDYYRSNLLLEEILPIIRGTEEAEKANFLYAYTYFHQKQYILSSHYFEVFAQVYARSEYAEEANFMAAFSHYNQSPVPSLDQSSTYEAIAAIQSFINRYPYSQYAEKANGLIDELQVKLETKAYQNAKLYYKLRRYKAAIIVIENFKDDYPDSKYNEELAFLATETAYELAGVSIRSVQEERYRKVLELYQAFVDKYENSKYLPQAEQYYEESIKQLSIFADQNKKNQ